jgi:hypothetical protein
MKLERKKTMPGLFFIEDSEAVNLVGSLEINESAQIYIDGLQKYQRDHLPNGKMINLTGITPELGKFLLIDSFTISLQQEFGADYQQNKILCNKLICVDKNHTGYEVKTSEMTFEIEDLAEWIAEPILQLEFEDDKHIYSYQMPKSITIDLDDDLSLTLALKIKFSTGCFDQSSEVKSTAIASFKAKEEKNLDFFIGKGITLSNLVSFGLDSVCTIKNAYYDNDPKKKVIFKTQNQMKEKKEIDNLNCFFTVKSLGNKYQKIIKNWFQFSEDIEPTISLYTQSKSKAYKYGYADFLALAQAAEALHQRTCNKRPWDKNKYKEMIDSIVNNAASEHKQFLKDKLSFGNEYSFKTRLEMMLSVIWSEEEIKNNNKILKDIVDMRNTFTHYPKRKSFIELNKLRSESHKYKPLLEKLIISNILFLLSSQDQNWVTSKMERINLFKFDNYL